MAFLPAVGFFSKCCCTEDQSGDADLLSATDERHVDMLEAGSAKVVSQFQPSPAHRAERGAGGGAGKGEEEAGPSAPLRVPTPSRGAEPPMEQARSTEEKHRLQVAVTAFVRAAVKGYPVTFLKFGGLGEPVQKVPCTFRVDKSLTQLRLTGDDVSVNCNLASIQDIYHVEEDGKSAFPSALTKSLTEEEQTLLLKVYHKPRGDKLEFFCMIEENLESKHRLLECLRILCIYAQNGGGSGAAPEGQ